MQMTKLRKGLEKFFYLQLCFSRCQSYYGQISGLISTFGMIVILLKVYGFSNIPIIIVTFVTLVIISVIVGHYDIKFGIAKIQTRVQNSINGELMDIHEVIKNSKKEKQKTLCDD